MSSKDIGFKVILVGAVGVGKTCIISRATSNTFMEKTESTIGSSTFEYTNKDFSEKLTIWDTAGQEAFDSFMPLYFKNATVAIIVYAINNRDSFNSINRWIDRIKENNIKIVYLVENKIDLRDDADTDDNITDFVSHDEGERKADELGYTFASVSALTGLSVDELFDNILNQCAKPVQNQNTIDENRIDLSNGENKDNVERKKKFFDKC